MSYFNASNQLEQCPLCSQALENKSSVNVNRIYTVVCKVGAGTGLQYRQG